MSAQRADGIKKILCLLGKEWMEYPDDVTEMLKKEFEAGSKEVDFTMLQDGRKSKFKMDFNKMVQINPYTKKSRKIKFIEHDDDEKFEVMGGTLLVERSPVSRAPTQQTNNSRSNPNSRPNSHAARGQFDQDEHDDEPQTEEEQDEREKSSRKSSGGVVDDAKEMFSRFFSGSQKTDDGRQTGTKARGTEVDEQTSTGTGDNELLRLVSMTEEKHRQQKLEAEYYKLEREREKKDKQGKKKDPGDMKLVFNSISSSESLRLALLHSGNAFEEEYIQGTKYDGMSIAGTIVIHKTGKITHSGLAALRYVGVQNKLYPKGDIEDQAVIDEAIEDLRSFQKQFFSMKEKNTDALVAQTMIKYERMLQKTKDRGLLGKGLTIGDFELVAVSKWLLLCKNVNADLFGGAFPHIMKLCDTVMHEPKVEEYTSLRKKQRFLLHLKSVEEGTKQMKRKPVDDW